jgi:hypothetical protein
LPKKQIFENNDNIAKNNKEICTYPKVSLSLGFKICGLDDHPID